MVDDVKYPVNAGFFNAINKDREYSADDMNRPYRKLISNGVFATPKGTASDDLQVFTANNGMNIIVSKGDAIIGNKWFENPNDLTITISQNSEILPRIDSIIAQVDRTQAGRAGNIVYRQGSASSNPVHPEINTDEDIFELRIADIIISPSCVKVTQELITDCRGSNECPWITSLIHQVDTSTLYTQWKAAYQKYYEDQKIEHDEYFEAFKRTMASFLTQEEQSFSTWFNQMKDQLSEDAAGNLLNLMDTKLDKSSINDIKGIPSCNENAQYQLGYYFNNEIFEEGLNSNSLVNPGSYSLKISKIINGIPSNLFSETDTGIKQILLEIRSNRTNIGIILTDSNVVYQIRQDLYDLETNRHWYRLILKNKAIYSAIDFGEWIEVKDLTEDVIASNAGAHNSIYRGKDITSLFYDGTLSQQISAGTFDDIFIGDYIVGQNSGRKYLVADLNYYLGTGNIPLNINHMLMVPEKIIGTGKMNDTDTGTDAYAGSKMYKQYLNNAKNIIGTDFGGLDNPTRRILSHKNLLPNSTGADNYVNGWGWCDSLIELMNESMVFGQTVWATSGYEVGIDNSQLALFRLDKSKIIAKQTIEEGTDGDNHWYWLRDLCFLKEFCNVGTDGRASSTVASGEGGIRPYFLLY